MSAAKGAVMNLKQIGLGILLMDFVALTAYAIWQHGYAAFLDVAAMNAVTLQITVDLIIALTIVSLWIWRDARARGISAVPYLMVTLVLGSIGPLLYLFRRAGDEEPATDAVRVPQVRHA
jgi:hypothetical protein